MKFSIDLIAFDHAKLDAKLSVLTLNTTLFIVHIIVIVFAVFQALSASSNNTRSLLMAQV